MIQELADVHFQDPATSCAHRLPPQTVQRLVRRPFGPKAVRARTKVLLVDRFQHHDDRPLEDLVLQGRDTNGSVSGPVPLGMCIRRTGGARYVPDLARSRSDSRLSRRFNP
jgi:hypothetical protein